MGFGFTSGKQAPSFLPLPAIPHRAPVPLSFPPCAHTSRYLGARLGQLLVTRVPGTAFEEEAVDVDAVLGAARVLGGVGAHHNEVKANLQGREGAVDL